MLINCYLIELIIPPQEQFAFNDFFQTFKTLFPYTHNDFFLLTEVLIFGQKCPVDNKTTIPCLSTKTDIRISKVVFKNNNIMNYFDKTQD